MRTEAKRTFKEIMRKIKTVAQIENTRVVFDFIQELNYRWVDEFSLDKEDENKSESVYTGKLGLKGRTRIGEKLKNWLTEIIEDTGFGKCYQNPLSNYLRIYMEMFDLSEENPDEIIRNLASMLKLFNALQFLNQNDVAHDFLPYAFEDMCLSLMEMTNCDSCSFLCHKKGEPVQIISRCGSVADSDDLLACINIRVTVLETVIDQFYSKSESSFNVITEDGLTHILSFNKSRWFKTEISGIKSIELIDEYDDFLGHHIHKRCYLVFEFPFNLNLDGTSNKDRAFYMILDYSENGKEFIEPTMEAFKVLTFRSRLWRALKDNYLRLIHTKFDYGYIESVVDGKSGVLHISDIHLSDERKWNVPNGTIIQKVRKSLREQHNKVDLLVVTGDVVNGSTNASDAQKKYSMVGAFLKEIAIELWAEVINGKTVLPHDWKKRILIVPGNHDYSAMSDVIVETASRRIRSGFPSNRSGGTMSKLTYYIEFIMNFLDAPIDELIENDMNEIRFYQKLNLKVALFNSVSKVNSLQNNKVSLNCDKIRPLIREKAWRYEEKNIRRIVLMHHAVGYSINYFDDKYEAWKYKLGNLYTRYYELLTEWIKDPVKAVTSQRSLMIKFKDDFEDMSKKYSYEFLKSQLYFDMCFLIRIYEKTISHDEYYEDFLAKHKMTYAMQGMDIKNFYDFYQENIGEKDIVLAGHEHRNIYYGKELKYSYAVPKLYDKREGNDIISFSVLCGNDVNNLENFVYKVEISKAGCNMSSINCPCAAYIKNQDCRSDCF